MIDSLLSMEDVRLATFGMLKLVFGDFDVNLPNAAKLQNYEWSAIAYRDTNYEFTVKTYPLVIIFKVLPKFGKNSLVSY